MHTVVVLNVWMNEFWLDERKKINKQNETKQNEKKNYSYNGNDNSFMVQFTFIEFHIIIIVHFFFKYMMRTTPKKKKEKKKYFHNTHTHTNLHIKNENYLNDWTWNAISDFAIIIIILDFFFIHHHHHILLLSNMCLFVMLFLCIHKQRNRKVTTSVIQFSIIMCC